MLARRGGWQTILADLSLILFMVSAAAMDRQPVGGTDPHLLREAAAVAVYRQVDGAPALESWLARQAPDARQRLTIISRYRQLDFAAAADAARQLAEAGVRSGVAVRVVVEPGVETETVAVLAYDESSKWHEDCTSAAEAGAKRARKENVRCE